MEFMTLTAMNKAIGEIGTARAKLVDKIQSVALSAINHAHVHGDTGPANRLAVAVGHGMKHEALRLWFAEYGPLNPNADKDTKAEAPMQFAKAKRVEGEELEAILTSASQRAWYDFKTENLAEFTFAGGLHALLNKINKANEKGELNVPEDQREAYEALMQIGAKVPKPAKKVAA